MDTSNQTTTGTNTMKTNFTALFETNFIGTPLLLGDKRVPNTTVISVTPWCVRWFTPNKSTSGGVIIESYTDEHEHSKILVDKHALGLIDIEIQ